MTRRMLWGVVAAAVYVAAALVVAHGGSVLPRPLYDGLAPAAPYRFVSPPPDLAPDNEQPEPGRGVVDLVKGTSQATSISTGDGQLQVVLQKGTFTAKEEKAADVRITPLVPPEPLDVGDGLRIEGNAYRVEAAFSKSKAAAEPRRALTIVLRYPNNATAMVRREGSGWTRLEGTENSAASLQLFAASGRLGVFAAAGKPHTTWTRWVPYGAGALGVIAGVVGYLSGRRGWLRRRPARKGKTTRQSRRSKDRARAKRKPGKQV